MKLKIIVIGIALLVVAGLISLFAANETDSIIENTIEVSNNTNSADFIETQKSNWVNYTSNKYINEKYGFELLFSKELNGYSVEENDKFISFGFPTAKQGVLDWNDLIFTMQIMPIADWNKYEEQVKNNELDIGISGQLRAKNENYAYILLEQQDASPDWRGRYKREEVISTLKLTQ